MLLAVAVNTFASKALPKLEIVYGIVHVTAFVAILIVLLYFAPHGSANDVFTLFLNEGGWSSQGLSFLVGMLGPAFSLLGEVPRGHWNRNYC